MFETLLTRGLRAVVAVAVVAAAFLGHGATRAAAGVKEDTALAFAPADVAFFSASLRQKEQYEDFVNSKAFAELQNIPAVAQLKQQLMIGMGMIAGATADPQNREALEMLGDMFSHEIFSYGDMRTADAIELFNRWNMANTQAGMRQAIRERSGEPSPPNNEQVMRTLLDMLKENQNLIGVPNIHIGFRLSDPERGARQIARLGMLVAFMAQQQPELAARFSQTQIAGGDFLTFQFDGEMIPWSELPVENVDEVLAQYEDVIERVNELKLTIALGVRGDYLLLSFLDDPQRLELDASADLLYDRDELAALREHAEKPFTGVGYTSTEFAARTGNVGDQLRSYQQVAFEALAAAGIDDSLKQEISDDIDSVREALESALPKAGAKSSFSYRTDRGYESYAYNWGEQPQVDGSQTLPILKHVGGNPILFYVSRAKSSDEDAEALFALLSRARFYFEQFALPEFTEDERAEYEELRDKTLPILQRMKLTFVEKFMPAFRDGQTGVVLSAGIESKQWFGPMPPAETAVPMLELALLCGVSDAKLAKEAGQELFAAVQDLMNALHEWKPEEFPQHELPAPEIVQESGNTLYEYKIPGEAGVDEQITPNAGLSDEFLVLSYSPAQTKRLLAASELAVDSTPLKAHTGPLASAVSFNWPALVDAVVPWIEYGVRQSTAQGLVTTQNDDANPGLDNDPAEAILDQVRAAVVILKCYRGSSSVTYKEGDAFVTHGESVWKDLE